MKHSSRLSSSELKTSTFKPAQIDWHAGMMAVGGNTLIETAQLFPLQTNEKMYLIEQEELSMHMCTYHHYHHLQDHAEVFLMLFYSWGFCTNLSEFTKQGLASSVCKSLPPTTQPWKKAETPRRHTQAVQFILNKDPHGRSQ